MPAKAAALARDDGSCGRWETLLEQDVDAIVNAWNRNLFPWWLLLPQGVSGAIKRRGGLAPFRELRRYGVLPLGGAVLTSAGRLPFQGIIHVAGIRVALDSLSEVRPALGAQRDGRCA